MADDVLILIAGPTGPSGFRGPSGPVGPMGSSGPSGPSGARGPSGFPGQTPSRCADLSMNNGYPINGICYGHTGPSGFRGPSGFQGKIGPIGFSGPSGPSGYNGPSVLHAIKRVINLPISGASGPIGPAGARGITTGIAISGPLGFSGNSGPSGFAGARGLIGAGGPSGPRGPSGFPGLGSFSGPVGVLGAAGPMGAKGPSGYQGSIGLDGMDLKSSTNSFDSNGYVFIYSNDNSFQNGEKLLSEYETRKFSANDFTIILTPGVYDFSGRNLELTASNLRIVGMGADDSVKIQSSFNKNGVGVIDQKTDGIYLENISIHNTYSGNSNVLGWQNDVAYFDKPYGKSAFSNSFVEFSITPSGEAIEKTFKKYFDAEDQIIFVEKIKHNSKDLIWLKEDLTQEEAQEMNLQIFNFSGFYKKTWRLVAGNITSGNSSENKVYTIENKEILVIEKPNPLNPQPASYSPYDLLNEFSYWPWNVKNFYIKNSGAFADYNISLSFDLNLKTIENSEFKNVRFIDHPVQGAINMYWSLGMAPSNYYGGDFTNCAAGISSFGGKNGYIQGNFYNCKGKDYSFTEATLTGDRTINSSKIINCEAGTRSFGSRKAKINGEFRNLFVGSQSYNYAENQIGVLTSGSYSNNIFIIGNDYSV